MNTFEKLPHLQEILANHRFKHVKTDFLVAYGDKHDGIIELVGRNNTDNFFEMGYYFGDDKPKPIVKISCMDGCNMGCNFCSLANEPLKKNLTAEEMYEQVLVMLKYAQDFVDIEKHHKVNFSGSGEPLASKNIVETLSLIGNRLDTSFKIATVFPTGNLARENFKKITQFAKNYSNPIQWHISLISTNEQYRLNSLTRGTPASFEEIRTMLDYWKENNPNGRKPNICLVLSKNTPVDPNKIKDILPPDLVNIRPFYYKPSENGNRIGLEVINEDEMHDIIRNKFMDAGYDVTHFVRSSETGLKYGLASNKTLQTYRGKTGIKIDEDLFNDPDIRARISKSVNLNELYSKMPGNEGGNKNEDYCK